MKIRQATAAVELGRLGLESDNLRIVTDSALLSTEATAGDLEAAGRSLTNLLEARRQEGII